MKPCDIPASFNEVPVEPNAFKNHLVLQFNQLLNSENMLTKKAVNLKKEY